MASINWAGLKPAELEGQQQYNQAAQSNNGPKFKALSLRFRVPLDHRNARAGHDTISLHADLVYARQESTEPSSQSITTMVGEPQETLDGILRSKTLLVYLCGGPGDANPPFRIPGLNTFALEQGWAVLYPSYRGTGASTTVDKNALSSLKEAAVVAGDDPDSALAKYLSHFRQDSIAADVEAIRRCLNKLKGNSPEIKWTLLGQSFGGWIATTCLSYFPAGLKSVYINAGLPPVGKTPKEVYQALYARVVGVNVEYYKRYPEDINKVVRVVQALAEMDGGRGAKLSNGGRLTAQSFMTVGRRLGGEGGLEEVHQIVERLAAILGEESEDPPTIPEEIAKKDVTSFRLAERPLYGVLHEMIYCCGPKAKSDWAAQQVGREKGGRFAWLRDGFDFQSQGYGSAPLYFSGEMIFESMLTAAGPELEPFIGPAQLLARKSDWPELYNEEQLQQNTVPVRALAYENDIYVDFNLSKEAANKIRGCQMLDHPDGWFHGTIKKETKGEEVLRCLFGK